ncbi:uncharacterized protein ALTATR162_LOCUS4190 [Alternaria atra]|uniref:WKF domain-containing protein n=1 Tax=Alternaria atra TaxID=119953 RepID=A0A8J2I293_9PLEO|nr:uncharacterized protein ALTATR162_LOCUS4190 [Alternaria atra]CAG5156392.1 unnamed protein product [Alternaria atra]
MAQDGARVPAWKRLGLALKNQTQSGVAVPEQQTSSSDPQSSTTYSAQETSYEQSVPSDEPAVNGKSSKLGKRKHQHEPAEDHQQDAKKSRVVITETEVNGVASHELPVVPIVESAQVEAVSEEAPATGKPVKGDSNYRKKKEKPVKRRRENKDSQDGDSQPQARSKHGSTLSPNEPAYATARPTLLASTELDHNNTAAAATPQKLAKKSSRKDASGSPPLTDRRKFVAFTPDTKKSDGNTGQDYFKAWVAEQKGTGAVSQPPEVSNFVLHSLIAEEEKTARRNGQLDKKQATAVEAEAEETSSSKTPNPKPEEQPPPKSASPPAETTTTPKPASKPAEVKPASAPAPKGKKKDPSVYIAYLTQYHNDRDNWKFNKAKQNDVVDNALNIFRIPNEHTDALVEYVAGLKGAGVIERLRERCRATVKDLEEQDAQMNEAEAKKVAQEDAEQERILKERKRRNTEGDMTDLSNHEYSPGFIRRLQRRRAEALLNALGRAAPVSPAVNPRSSINPLMEHVEPAKPIARKRKRRTEVSSDESSSDSSDDSSDADSDASSDSESGSDNEHSAKGASSSGSSSKSSGSDSDSDSD